MYVFEILDEVRKQRSKEKKISILKKHDDNWALKDIIRGSMDSTVKWSIPDGEPPYTPSDAHNHPSDLKRQNTKFAFLVQGMYKDTPKFKKERIYFEILEGIHPEDAKLVIAMISKQTPKGLTRPVVNEAYPGLLQD